MRYFILVALLSGNPMLGPHDDWAPLLREYAQCQEAATSYFNYTVCTVGAFDRALYPSFNA